MTSSKPNYFPVAPFPSIVTWRVGLLHKDFAGTYPFGPQQPSLTLGFSFIYQQGLSGRDTRHRAEEPEGGLHFDL